MITRKIVPNSPYLMKQQQETTLDFTNEILYNCIQCSGPYRGDETCEELKQLHNTTSPAVQSVNVLTGETEENTGGDKLSFCESYNNCVRSNCPPLCWKEHVRWLECVIIELDCDLGCESVELGHGFVGEEFILGVTNSDRKRSGAAEISFGFFGLLISWFLM